VLDEAPVRAVVPHRDRLRAVFGGDLLHLLRDVGERLVPRDGRPLLLAALAAADEGPLQPVEVVVRSDRGSAARAEAAAAHRVERIALALPELAIADMGNEAAPPEAHFAVGGDRLDHSRRRLVALGERRDSGDLATDGAGAARGGGDLEETPAGEMFHDCLVANGVAKTLGRPWLKGLLCVLTG
jgi:hypothetical protein